MNQPAKPTSEVNALLDAWRTKAMNLVVILLVGLSLPGLVLGVILKGGAISIPVRVGMLSVILVLLLVLWRRDWGRPWRIGLFFTAAYAMTAIMWIMNGLVGSGRISLIVLPLLALVLIGYRAGWLAAAVSVAMFAAFTVLAHWGAFEGRFFIQTNTTELGFWVLQGLAWLAALIPLMVLLGRFQALQTKLVIEEHHARAEIEATAAERRRLEAALTQISEQERTRVGAELHDGLCQQLTAALLNCTALENQLSARAAAETEATRRLRRSLEDCIGSAYDAAKGLCPVGLSSGSLGAALQRLSWQTQRNAGVACELRQCDPAPHFPASTTLHLYRIAQEAVNNALKHAACRHIILELRGENDAFILTVTDDGQPLDAVHQRRSGGIGTQIMNYRANSIGGTLWIEHPRGGGTVVGCRLPGRIQPPGQSLRDDDTELTANDLSDAKVSANFPG